MNERDRQRQHILTALADAWERNPNLRFGQLVESVLQPGLATGVAIEQHYDHCIYHVVDEKVLACLLDRAAA